MPVWKILKTISTFKTHWFTLIGELLLDEDNRDLDYWRIEKDDSVIIIPIQKKSIIMPKVFYRHGIKEETLDFPGGRRAKDYPLHDAALGVLERELAINRADVISLDALNSKGWPVNSSFSNQLLYGLTAKLNDAVVFDPAIGVEKVPITLKHLKTLLNRMHCLQCRSVLLEWMQQNNLLFE
jgi:hypothetical protein